jgi:hypothetical protein|tara:strand:+ start:6112 stop:7068 length:957 start_codon:yes stop_codon:yes gene_type:complete
VSDETVNEMNVEESAGSTGLLDEPNDAGFDSGDQSFEDSSVQFADDAPSASPEIQTEPVKFDPLSHEIDDEELKTDGFYDGITEHDIKELPTVARRMLHNFRVAYKMKQNELDQTNQSRLGEYKKREQQIEHLERDFARRQAEFASLIEDPSIKEALKIEDGELPDIMSEDGINAHINRRVAEAVSGVFAPMQQASAQRRQESAFYDFLESHPEMKNPGFKKEVASLVTERKNTDAPLSTQDAYEVVKARKIMAQQRARTEQERRARADAARRVQRNSVSGSPGAMQIPPDVKRQGAASIAAWLQSNPEAAKAFSNNR